MNYRKLMLFLFVFSAQAILAESEPVFGLTINQHGQIVACSGWGCI